jgi:hypothetical protein
MNTLPEDLRFEYGRWVAAGNPAPIAYSGASHRFSLLPGNDAASADRGMMALLMHTAAWRGSPYGKPTHDLCPGMVPAFGHTRRVSVGLRRFGSPEAALRGKIDRPTPVS